MKLVVITPVGPWHEEYAKAAAASVEAAMRHSMGRFTEVRHVIVDDTRGQMGRARARNCAMAEDADWYFFLDADDTMFPLALEYNDFDVPATFGAVWHDGMIGKRKQNVYPCGWREIALCGARGTLSMGFFVDAALARNMRFREDIDVGEDYDFYMRLPRFTKVQPALVAIGYRLPSAGGPRGYVEVDWIGTCDAIIEAAVEREPDKYDLRGDAVLAKAQSTGRERRELFAALSRRGA